MKRVLFLMLLLLSGIEIKAKPYTILDEAPASVVQRREQTMKMRGDVAIIRATDSNQSESATIAARLLTNAGFNVKNVITIPNADVAKVLAKMMQDPQLLSIICIGGTGISASDTTVEALKALTNAKEIPGYGEYFRQLTQQKWQEYENKLGLLAIDTRATAVVADNKVIFAVPGSPDATELAVSKIIIPGLPTLIGQLSKKN